MNKLVEKFEYVKKQILYRFWENILFSFEWLH